MTRPGVRWRAVVCGMAIALGVTACTTSSADDPSTSSSGTTPSASVIDPSTASSGATASSPPVSPTPSVIDVPTPSPANSTPLDPEAQEIADRAAVEAAWNAFWVAVEGVVRAPENERDSMMSAVAVDPIRSQILTEARESAANGLDRYGTVTAHPYWDQLIDGKNSAVMGDCQDASQFGVLDTSTGEKQTIGVVDNNTRAEFVRGEDQVWRVRDIFFLVDERC